ncbi:MAG: thioredoxin family protein [Saprospiraceae bacterium]|nr:thioredoxin family protein [Saprospiraceae bacterium]
MKNVKILGTGCPKCKQTATLVETAVQELGLQDVKIEKVEDIMKIMEYDVMSTPAIVIDGDIKVKGRIPSIHEMKELLQ